MLNKLLFVVVVTIMISNVAALNCSSPVFTDANEFFNAPVFELTESTVENDVCPGLVGEESCCTSIFFDAIEEEWRKFFIEYAQAQVELTALTIEAQRNFEAEIEKSKDEVQANNDIPQEIKDKIIDAFDKLVVVFNNFFESFVDALVKCINVILRFMIGIICLSCRPDWAQFIDSNVFIRYILANEVCDDIKEGCSDLLQIQVDLYSGINDTLFELHQAIFPGLPYTPPDNEVCEDAPTPGDCDSYMCFELVKGLNTDVDDANDQSGDRMSRTLSALEPIEKMINRPNAFAKTKASLAKAETLGRDMRMKAQAMRRRADSIQNEYSANGYNAIAVGNESKLDKDVSASNPLFTIFTYF